MLQTEMAASIATDRHCVDHCFTHLSAFRPQSDNFASLSPEGSNAAWGCSDNQLPASACALALPDHLARPANARSIF